MPMLAIAIFAGAFGAVFGTHCKILVLIPAMLFALAATFAVGFVSGANPHTVFLAMLAILASLQLGYFAAGIAATYLWAPTKLSHRGWTSSQY
jgi:hypothetical protein